MPSLMLHATIAYAVSSILTITLRRPTTSTLFPYTTLFRSRCDENQGLGKADAVFPGCENLGVKFDNEHPRSEEHTSELQSLTNLVCRLLLEKKKSTPQCF